MYARQRCTCSPRGNATRFASEPPVDYARDDATKETRRTNDRITDTAETREAALTKEGGGREQFRRRYFASAFSLFSSRANDFIAGLFVPIARTTGRSYSKFSAARSVEERARQLERNGRYYAHSRTKARTSAGEGRNIRTVR